MGFKALVMSASSLLVLAIRDLPLELGRHRVRRLGYQWADWTAWTAFGVGTATVQGAVLAGLCNSFALAICTPRGSHS